MKQLIIIGASGHGKVVADIAKNNGYSDIAFLDDNDSVTECNDYKVLGKVEEYKNYDCDFLVAIGNAHIRAKIIEKLISANKSIPTLVHPNAIIGENVKIGVGTVIMAGAVINPATIIGDGCIINTCASVDHDNNIGDYVHISVGAHTAGTVTIDNYSWIGIGAVISNNISICSNCMIGAGAVVVNNLMESGTYIGVPAKMCN